MWGVVPFILFYALKPVGFDAVAVDYDPEDYEHSAEVCGILNTKVDTYPVIKLA